MEITEEKLKELGFKRLTLEGRFYEFSIREAKRMSIRIRYDFHEYSFWLITVSDWRHDGCELKINIVADIKEVIKRGKELAEFMK